MAFNPLSVIAQQHGQQRILSYFSLVNCSFLKLWLTNTEVEERKGGKKEGGGREKQFILLLWEKIKIQDLK